MSHKVHLIGFESQSMCGIYRPKTLTRSIRIVDCRSCLRQYFTILHNLRRNVIVQMDKLGMFPGTPAGRDSASREEETNDATDL